MLLNELGEQFASAGDTRAAERCFDKARELAQKNEELSTDDLRSGGSPRVGRQT